MFIPVAGVDQNGDGVDDRTAVDIIRPAETASGLKVPAIIDASPYFTSVGDHSQFIHTTAGVPDRFPQFYDNYFVPRGYAVLLAQANGTAFSTGCPLHGGPGDIASIAAVIDWLQGRVPAYKANGDPAVADWDNGKAALIGKSYDGTLANGVAATGVNGLTTIVPISAISDWYSYSRSNGIRFNTHYPSSLAGSVTTDQTATVLGDTPPDHRTPCTATRTQMNADDGDATGDRNAFWDDRNYLADVSHVRAAVFASVGLNDDNVRSDHFGPWWEGLAANNVPRKLWLSQEGHVDPFDYRRAEWVDALHRWFDFWLYGIPNGIMGEPRVTIERSTDVFQDEPDWPLPGTRDVDVFLRATAAGSAGTLADVSGGTVDSLTFTDLAAQTENTTIASPTGSQANRLVFLSPVLTQDVRLAGTAMLRLRAALSTTGGNLGVLLVDYSAMSFTKPNLGGSDGVFTIAGTTCWGDSTALDSACYANLEKRTVSVTSWLATKGILDTRNRDSLHTPSDLVAHGDYDFTLPALPTDYVFAAGHQIGVIVVSSYRSYSSIADPNRPDVTVDTHRSRITLPIVGGAAAATAAGLFADTAAPTLHLPGAASAEATGVTTPVSFSAIATDDRDPRPSVVCTPAAGAAFPLGTTTVNCTATDSGGNSANGSFDVTVVDTTAPALQLPPAGSAEATSPSGAPVSYAAEATDLADPHPTLSCLPASGATFPLGTTTVHCTGTDAHGNHANGSFDVTVADSTAPALQLPATTTALATSAGGAAVSYGAGATDLVDPSPIVSCLPAAGATFPLGTTTVHCTATDAGGNIAHGSFDVTVADKTAPALRLPALVTAEATSPAGAAVAYSATASDLIDASPTVSCAPASGSTLPLGTTTVNCTATDSSGNAASGSFDATVADTTAPVLQLPATIFVVAGSASGAPVAYTATATDAVDPHPRVACLPASGSTFAVAATPVHCTATDAQGNVRNGSFQIVVAPPPPPPLPAPVTATITDATAPSLRLPAPTAEATSPGGTAVTYAVNAADDVDTAPVVSCAPASGSVFPIGRTTVRCTATDASGNSSNGTFEITVADTTAPALDLPAPIDVDAKRRSGVPVRYRVSARDAADASPDVACAPASGSRFAVGTTRVRCTATDAAGNVGRESFVVHVDGAADQLRDLVAAARNTALVARIKAIQRATAAGKKPAACRDLRAFEHAAPTKSAAPLRAQARRIAAILGC